MATGWLPRVVPQEMLEGIVDVANPDNDNTREQHVERLTKTLEVLLTCGDTVSDIVNLVLLWDSHFGPIMLGMLIFANLMQVVFTRFVNHQGVLATIASPPRRYHFQRLAPNTTAWRLKRSEARPGMTPGSL